ncbi:MAG: hypothetical protein ACREAU_06020 [Nitrosopumilaceae archaeon]
MKTRLSIIVAIVMTISVPHAFAASLIANIGPYEEQFKPSFQFQKTIIIYYDESGKIRDEMWKKDIQVYFSENSSNPQVLELMQKLNQNLEDLSSQTRITELELTVKERMKGNFWDGSFEYEITLVPTITNFTIDDKYPDPYKVIDTNWRGIEISDEIIINTDEGKIDINHPISFIKEVYPGFYEIIQGTEVGSIISKPMINSTSLLNKKLSGWKFLFQPNSSHEKNFWLIPSEWKDWTVSTFVIGDFSGREGSRVEINEIEVISDKSYQIRIFQSTDRGLINTKGFATVDFIGGNEVIVTTPEVPSVSYSSPGIDFQTWMFLIIGLVVASLVVIAFYLSRGRK